MHESKQYSIGELVELTGISRRAVRFYVQKTLLPPPLGAGRGHYYTEAHVERIRKIKDLQDAGFSLDEIEHHLRGPLPDLFGITKSSKISQLSLPSPELSPAVREEKPPSLWTRIEIAPGVEMQIESGTYRLSPARLKKLGKAVREILGTGLAPLRNNEEGEES